MSIQSTAGIKGTPVYIAPESWLNDEYTKAEDFWLLPLEVPFRSFTIPMFYSKVIRENYRPEFKCPIADHVYLMYLLKINSVMNLFKFYINNQ